VCAFVAGRLSSPTDPLARWLPIVVVATGSLSLLARAIDAKKGGAAWAVLAVALGVWVAGSAADAINGVPPADANGLGAVCRVAFYPLAYLGFVQLVRGRIKRFATALWLDGLIGALAVAAVGVGVLIQPALESTTVDLADLVVRLVLPLGDLLLLAFIAGIMALNAWRPSRAWIIMGAGLGLMALTHTIEITFSPTSFPGLELTTLLGPIGLTLIGLASWWPSTLSTQLRIEGWGLLVGPTLFGWLTVALVAYGNFVELGAVGLGLATITLVLVMVRTGLTFRENIAIAEELRSEVAHSNRDALTGLLNHRSFHTALAAEVEAAHRRETDLSLVVFDIDDFRLINDRYGHEAGDRVLRQIAEHLDDRLRNEDHLARIGGEEFACLLPEAAGTAAWLVAERARQMVEDMVFLDVGSVTVSAGVCDLAHAASATELLRLADGALYWAKTHGRNSVARYQPDLMDVLSVEDRAAQAERARTLSAVSALARAVDAKDPSTHRHSERVGSIAGAIAARLGWDHHGMLLLREAALVHDVGKIGVPDNILTKPGPLTSSEFEVMKTHAALGAQIVRDVLTPDQTLWILHHHERWDGDGYPEKLHGPEIPEGARIMAVADAWDAMTAHRAYRRALAADEALAILRTGAGAHWWADAIAAALDLYEDGLLTPSAVADDEDERAAASVLDGLAGTGGAKRNRQVDPMSAGQGLTPAVADGPLDGDRVEPAFDEVLSKLTLTSHPEEQ
jgi:diguanylate cyclase (GGDEF)-like protein/putative nucleotidyltransferase with HDIG domain